MPFDPTKPAASTPLSSAEMRAQLNALNDAIAAAEAGSAVNPASVAPLDFEPADPPSIGEIWLLLNKINELIAALKRV